MNDYIGKKVLIRANGAGVYFGTLEKMEGDQVKVSNERNIGRWTGASCLSQIANEGVTGNKIGPVVSSMVINSNPAASRRVLGRLNSPSSSSSVTGGGRGFCRFKRGLLLSDRVDLNKLTASPFPRQKSFSAPEF